MLRLGCLRARDRCSGLLHSKSFSPNLKWVIAFQSRLETKPNSVVHVVHQKEPLLPDLLRIWSVWLTNRSVDEQLTDFKGKDWLSLIFFLEHSVCSLNGVTQLWVNHKFYAWVENFPAQLEFSLHHLCLPTSMCLHWLYILWYIKPLFTLYWNLK